MKYEYWLASIPQLSDKKKILLRKRFGTGKDIFYIEVTKLKVQEFLNREDLNTIMQAQKIQNLKDTFENLAKKIFALFHTFQKNFLRIS